MLTPRDSNQSLSSRRRTLLSGQSSATQCRCHGSAAEIHPFHKTDDGSAAEAIFQLAQQAMDFWQRLKTCHVCFDARIDDLLATLDNIVCILKTTIEGLDAPGTGAASSATSEAPGQSTGSSDVPPWDMITSGIDPGPQNIPNTALSPVSSGVLPRMALGRFTLDQQQGLSLFRSMSRRILQQIASVLNEMQQLMNSSLHLQWDGDLGDFLFTVLQITDMLDE